MKRNLKQYTVHEIKDSEAYFFDFVGAIPIEGGEENPFSSIEECQKAADEFNLKVIAQPDWSLAPWTIEGEEEDLKKFVDKYYTESQKEDIAWEETGILPSEEKESLNENLEMEDTFIKDDSEEKITLVYPSLKIEQAIEYIPSTRFDPEEYIDSETEIDDYEFDVDKDDVEEVLIDLIPNEENLSDEELYKYIDENLSELAERYSDEILDYFKEKAIEEAQEKHYMDYLEENNHKRYIK